jgi:hypothetical protein
LIALLLPASHALATCGWTPAPAGKDDVKALASLSSSDVWAVGYQTQHWDGSNWNLVANPQPNPHGSVLLAVDAASDSDIWAAGYQGRIWRRPHSMIQHWNGSSWSIVDDTHPSVDGDVLNGIAALSANDIWAVGFSKQGDDAQNTLVEHWDGTSWTVVPSPNTDRLTNSLEDVLALGPDDVWAVGSTTGGHHKQRTLAMHWDGIHWSIVHTPNPGDVWDYITAIDGSSANDIWAVGDKGYRTHAGYAAIPKTLTLHWDGATWSVIDSPHVPGKIGDYLNDVDSIATNDVWAVGTDKAGSSTLAIHWDGSAWLTVPTQDPGNSGNWLEAVSATSSQDVWVAGQRFDTDQDYQGMDPPSTSATLTEHWGC